MNRTLKLRIAKPDFQTILLLMWLCEVFVLTAARFVLNRIGMSEGVMRNIILWGIASIPLLVFFLHINRFATRQYVPFLLLFAAIIISMIISILANPALIEFFVRSFYGVERIFRPDCALYAFLFFSIFDDPRKLKKNLTTYAYLYFIYLIVTQLLPALARGYWVDIGPSGQENRASYNLSFGYAMAFPTMVFLQHSIKRHKAVHIVLSIIGIWCVVTQGNRGALLVLVVFIGLMTVSNIIGSENVSRRILKIVVIIFAIIIVAVFGNLIFNAVISFLRERGITSRTIEMLLGGTIADDNGREIIWLTVIGAIRDGSIFGHGMLGDRPYVLPLHIAGYSHNLFLELLVSYGVIGVVIIGRIISDSVRMILLCKNDDWRELYIILFSCSCQLMLSMSFWYVWQFWAAAAIAHRYFQLKKSGQVE